MTVLQRRGDAYLLRLSRTGEMLESCDGPCVGDRPRNCPRRNARGAAVTDTADPRYVVEDARTFTFNATPEQVWAVLECFESLAAGWRWLRELRIDGPGLARGTVVRGVVAPPLPYRMRLEVILDDCVPERCIDASVHGDLEGVARIAFEGDDTDARARNLDDRDETTGDARRRPARAPPVALGARPRRRRDRARASSSAR